MAKLSNFVCLATLESRTKASSDDEQLEETAAESITTNRESSVSALDSSIHGSGCTESKADVEKENFESKSTSDVIEEAQPQMESGTSDISVIVTNSECTPAAL